MTFWVVLASFLATGVRTAEVEKTPDDEMHCYLSVNGQIEEGDVEKIRAAMADFDADHPDEQRLTYPNSMNSWRKVCFDSSGGSFSEGVEIAQYLLSEQVGSAVPRDAECVSACAVAFMGGTHDSKTDAGDLIWRQLHPLGSLGFHASFIEVPDRNYSNRVVQMAFEGALSNIGLLLDRGDDMHFPRSLLLRMLNTASGDMHYVETVGEASRWGIAIAPVAPRNALEPESVVNACYNQEAFFQDRPMRVFADGGDVEMRHETAASFGLLPFGFRSELASACEISQIAASEHYRYGPLTHRASHYVTENAGVYPYQMYDPLTPIAALADTDGKPPVRIQEFNVRRQADAVCLVFADNELTDSEACRWEGILTRRSDMSVEEVWQFHWPSGSRTLVVPGDAQAGEIDTINGSPARKIASWAIPESLSAAIHETAEVLTFGEDAWLSENCWKNKETERVFCVGSFEEMKILHSEGSIQ